MEWRRGPTIGRGSSANVSIATATTGELFAVKSIDLSSFNLLQKEQNLISQLCSPFVVKCLGSDITYSQNSGVYNLFLEYISGGTLSDLVKNHGGSFNEKLIQFYANQMLQGLNYLHLKGIVHCDIKGQNLLISNGGLKIADFGCAKWIDCGDSATSEFSGTPAYMAPEVSRGEEQSFPADIWSMGCTIIEMATGSNPWPEMKDPVSALYRIGYSNDTPEIPSWFSDNAKDFLAKCLMRDPKERWTTSQLLQHPFTSSVGEICEEIGELTKKSPTSVMDQGFWDAVEVSDSSRNLTGVADSPVSRIRGLIGGNLFSHSGFLDWSEDEDWVTVRGNDIQDCEELIEEESVMFSVIDAEEIETSIVVEDLLFNFFTDEIRDEDGSEFFNDSEDDICVLKNRYFERFLMELFIHPAQLFFYCSS